MIKVSNYKDVKERTMNYEEWRRLQQQESWLNDADDADSLQKVFIVKT